MNVEAVEKLKMQKSRLYRSIIYDHVFAEKSIVLGQCELLKQAGIVWINVTDRHSIDVVAHQLTDSMQRVVEIESSAISYATSPHLTMAYRDYSDGDIDAIFDFINPMCRSILPLQAEIDGIVLCCRDGDGTWRIATPHP